MAIAIAFFGRAPMWLPAFLLSCGRNPDVQWFLYTDFEAPAPFPPNVTLRRMPLSEFSQRASDALGTRIEIQPNFAKKIIDLKPAFGLIFEDDLRGFDFWAHSDLDIVWGDVRHFMTDELLARYDMLSSRPGRTSGHFNLFRNTPVMNRTFELIPDARQAMSNPEYLHLDERELTRHLKQHLSLAPVDAPRVYWPSNLTTDASCQRALSDGQSLWWRGGKTFGADGHEFMYLHFHKLKNDSMTINFGFDDRPAAFGVDRRGFSA